jgi:hypothetical protein
MEYAMKFLVASTAIGLALAAGATAAQAQTIISPQPMVTVPAATVVSQPLETVQTTETVRTIRPAPARTARRQIVTTRTVTRQIVPTTAVVARTGPVVQQPLYDAAPQPLYDEVTAPLSPPLSNPDNTPALYDTAVPVAAGPTVAAPFAAGAYNQPFTYRYVYEPDRILVVDPTSGIAVQAIPR